MSVLRPLLPLSPAAPFSQKRSFIEGGLPDRINPSWQSIAMVALC